MRLRFNRYYLCAQRQPDTNPIAYMGSDIEAEVSRSDERAIELAHTAVAARNGIVGQEGAEQTDLLL
jgi:hypothetical protein